MKIVPATFGLTSDTNHQLQLSHSSAIDSSLSQEKPTVCAHSR
ncbi:MAG: hypothetical protein AAFR24_00360 [Cyanobacteria bacterium J06627_3]